MRWDAVDIESVSYHLQEIVLVVIILYHDE